MNNEERNSIPWTEPLNKSTVISGPRTYRFENLNQWIQNLSRHEKINILFQDFSTSKTYSVYIISYLKFKLFKICVNRLTSISSELSSI
jgi:hypothetical protein